MKEIYEKVIKDHPELEKELRGRIEIDKSIYIINTFMEVFSRDSNFDNMLIGVVAYIISKYMRLINEYPEDEIHAETAIKMLSDVLKSAQEHLDNHIAQLKE